MVCELFNPAYFILRQNGVGGKTLQLCRNQTASGNYNINAAIKQ
jgi:hypothetical protein